MRTELFMYFCIKNYIGCIDCKNITHPPPVVYVTVRSKAVVPVLFLFCEALCGLYYGALHALRSCLGLYPRVSLLLLALWSPRLRKRELV